jgi:hypothetical protein
MMQQMLMRIHRAGQSSCIMYTNCPHILLPTAPAGGDFEWQKKERRKRGGRENEWMNDELHLKCRSLELLSGQQTSRGLTRGNPLAYPYQRVSSTESNSKRPRPLDWWALLVLIWMKQTANGSAPKPANWACKWVTAHLVMDPIQLCLLTCLLDIT